MDKQEAYLVKPGDTEEMTKALMELISNAELRMLLIRNAFSLAQESTLQIQTRKMIDILKSYIV